MGNNKTVEINEANQCNTKLHISVKFCNFTQLHNNSSNLNSKLRKNTLQAVDQLIFPFSISGHKSLCPETNNTETAGCPDSHPSFSTTNYMKTRGNKSRTKSISSSLFLPTLSDALHQLLSQCDLKQSLGIEFMQHPLDQRNHPHNSMEKASHSFSQTWICPPGSHLAASSPPSSLMVD